MKPEHRELAPDDGERFRSARMPFGREKAIDRLHDDHFVQNRFLAGMQAQPGVGIVLLGLEFIVNLNSNLNLSLADTFMGDINSAHHVINYRWALFYPSLYGYAIWQAFNFAIANNNRINGKDVVQRTYLSGFFIGLVLGMDFGLFWHDSSLIRHYTFIRFLDYPVFNGLAIGLLTGIFGHIMENRIYRKHRKHRARPG